MNVGSWVDESPADPKYWPGAQRRRAEQPDNGARAADGIDPVLTPAPASVAQPYDVGQLDADGLAKLHAIAERAGVDPAAIGQRVHLARTRRGLIVMLTVYTLDAAGEPVTVLGVPDVRHVIRPVTVDELPAAWLQVGDR